MVHGYSRVVCQALLYAAVTQKKRIQVYVTESRPVSSHLSSSSFLIVQRAYPFSSRIKVWIRIEDSCSIIRSIDRMSCHLGFCCVVHNEKSRFRALRS